MKKCPQCGREYDHTMSFCLDDGSELLYGPARSEPGAGGAPAGASPSGVQVATGFPADEPQTAILHSTAASGDAPTRAQVNTTDQTAIFPLGAEAEPQESLGGPSERLSLSAHQAAKPQGKFGGRNGLVLGLALAVLLLVGGFLGYRYLGSSPKQIESIAVMPFVNETGDPDVEYLSDGMTETLITSLSRLPGMNVKPRSMVFRYKGKEIDLQTVGKELGVEAILSGQVVSRGDNISLFVELIDVASTKVVWSRQYTRKQSDLVALQSEIARDVSGTLKAELSGEEERRVTQTGTDNPEAYRLYLLGRSLAERRKERDALKAIDAYEQAIALDPNYALAYLGLAQAHQFTAVYGNVPATEALPKGRAALLRAREIAPDLPGIHIGLASIELFMVRDFAASEREVRKALELNPNLGEAHRVNGLRLAYLNRPDEASAEFRKAVDSDPTAATPRLNYAWSLFYMGRIDESDAELRAVQELEPSSWFVEFLQFINSRYRRDHSAAVDHLARALDLRDEPDAAKFIRDSYRTGGWKGMMRSVIAAPDKAKVWDYYVATFAAELGDKDTAFAFLDKSADKYDQFILFAKIDPAMEPLRGDPRYGDLLKKLGLQ